VKQVFSSPKFYFLPLITPEGNIQAVDISTDARGYVKDIRTTHGVVWEGPIDAVKRNFELVAQDILSFAKPNRNDWVRGKMLLFPPNSSGKTQFLPFRFKDAMIEGEGNVIKIDGTSIEVEWTSRNQSYHITEKKQLVDASLRLEVGDKVIFLLKGDHVLKQDTVIEVELCNTLQGNNLLFHSFLFHSLHKLLFVSIRSN
jgi:hypothetical protein